MEAPILGIIASDGNERQIDEDILAKCLLQARSKNRLAEHLGKITVDSPSRSGVFGASGRGRADALAGEPDPRVNQGGREARSAVEKRSRRMVGTEKKVG